MVNVHDAKTRFSKLLARVARGGEVIIARAGRPVAKLVPYDATHRHLQPPGAMRGQIWMADDFDAPLADVFDDLADRMH